MIELNGARFLRSQIISNSYVGISIVFLSFVNSCTFFSYDDCLCIVWRDQSWTSAFFQNKNLSTPAYMLQWMLFKMISEQIMETRCNITNYSENIATVHAVKSKENIYALCMEWANRYFNRNCLSESCSCPFSLADNDNALAAYLCNQHQSDIKIMRLFSLDISAIHTHRVHTSQTQR